jgi:polycomb protein EED
MRFSMFHAAGKHPVLAFCNARSNVYFWDMARLTSYHEFMAAIQDPNRDKSTPVPRPPWLQPIQHRTGAATVSRLRDASDKDSMVSGTASPDPDSVAGLNGQYSAETIAGWESKYGLNEPHEIVKPHKIEKFSTTTLVGRQVAWSPEGEWCVIVGSKNVAVIFQRWAKDKVPQPAA